MTNIHGTAVIGSNAAAPRASVMSSLGRAQNLFQLLKPRARRWPESSQSSSSFLVIAQPLFRDQLNRLRARSSESVDYLQIAGASIKLPVTLQQRAECAEANSDDVAAAAIDVRASSVVTNKVGRHRQLAMLCKLGNHRSSGRSRHQFQSSSPGCVMMPHFSSSL